MTDNPWIEWKGGECPVHPAALVNVQYLQESRGAAERYEARRADFHGRMWQRKRGQRIIAYRLSGPTS